jgi:hypothetical protein
MAEKDLNHAMGNQTCADMLRQMKPKNKATSNVYAGGKKGPKLPTAKTVQKGWTK